MRDEANGAYRFTDIVGEPMRRLPPLRGCENIPLVSIKEATRPLIPHVPEIEHMMHTIEGNNMKPEHDLTIDESAAIALYSLEWSPRKNSFYIILNNVLRHSERDALLPPWFKFLKLLLIALSKLPSTGRRAVYRGVKLNLREHYKRDTHIVWRGFSSCTTAVDVLRAEEFFGKTGTRTLFASECDTGREIRQHSFYPNEEEILLLPGRELQVVALLDMGHQVTMIQLTETVPQFPNIAAITASSPSATISKTTTTATPKAAASSSSVVPKSAPRPKLPVKQVKVSYRRKNITDADIQRIIKEAIIRHQCTGLDLHDNEITRDGAAMLGKVLRNNMTLNTVDLSRNEIGDKGAQHLANALQPRLIKTDPFTACLLTTLTILDLRYNQIGDRGAQHLANALQHNTVIIILYSTISFNQLYVLSQTLTTLDLSGNEIGDELLDCVAELIERNERQK
ncbi:unnamed protein product [Rotaria magnacalcarata]